MKEVSLVVPVYNDYKYLKENLLPSLELQKAQLEIIVVDDASDDESDLLLYEDIKKNIDQYISLKQHVGANYARTKGFRKVVSEYLIFSDADIFFYPGVIDRMLSRIKEYDADFVYGDFVWKGEEARLITMKAMPWDINRLYQDNYISFVSLIKTSVAERAMPLDKSIDRLQDWDFWLEMAERGFKGEYMDETLFMAVLKTYGISARGKADYLKWKNIIQNKHKRLKNEVYRKRRKGIK